MHDRRGRQNTCEDSLAEGSLSYDDNYLKRYQLITRQTMRNPTFHIPKDDASLAPTSKMEAYRSNNARLVAKADSGRRPLLRIRTH
ncbi:hypothetical protein CQW23_23224 [Capsicum baccatum]|uniref:Uncharacterized protein n=1 Tax=Capsicum baccatum TaxID=33114 RepID=A0A2G2VRC2_CAPBA|nr:hypothetical protein CQW23_23224 [Capsicum baccatum]